jgi:hypothetical protein
MLWQIFNEQSNLEEKNQELEEEIEELKRKLKQENQIRIDNERLLVNNWQHEERSYWALLNEKNNLEVRYNRVSDMLGIVEERQDIGRERQRVREEYYAESSSERYEEEEETTDEESMRIAEEQFGGVGESSNMQRVLTQVVEENEF